MSQPVHLPHSSDDCTGEWRQVADGEPWGCARCGTEHPSTPENDRAATLEFIAGVVLESQTRQGRFRDLPVPPPREISIEFPDEDDEDLEY